MLKRSLFLLLFLLVIDTAAAATIHGSVYDLSLDKQSNAVISINSTPRQNFVSVDGSYRFVIPDGDYQIIAVFSEQGIMRSSASESISISDDGEYVLDIILFPVLDEDIDEVPIFFEEEADYHLYMIFGLVLVFFGLIILLIFHYKKLIRSTVDDDHEILRFIKEKGGRVTQKDIRRRFPSSEAKISLIITELEHKGKVEKIKKGRGNVIILR